MKSWTDTAFNHFHYCIDIGHNGYLGFWWVSQSVRLSKYSVPHSQSLLAFLTKVLEVFSDEIHTVL
jgi:hypothetical protein